MMMRAVPEPVRFIILQGPSHASLSEGNYGDEKLSCALAFAFRHTSTQETCPCRGLRVQQ